jgi:Head domain of trimeric autotransporter adhesin
MTCRFLLLAASAISLNAALLSSASAATCVTGVTPTFANVVSDVSGQPGATVVTAVTPTMAPALTGVTTSAVPFLTSATLLPVTGTAVTGVTFQTNSVTGLQPGATSNLQVPAFDPASNPSGTSFTFPNGSTTFPNGGTVNLNPPQPPGGNVTLLTVPVVSGTVAPPQTVVTDISAPQQNNFLTSGTTVTTQASNAITSVTPSSAQFVNGLNVSTAPVLTGVTPTTTPVVNSVAVSNSGASADASSLGCGVSAMANGTNSVALGTNAAGGTNSVALGQGAQALGMGSTAIGQGASTGSFNNAMAIGNGAVATRDNQVVIGTASNTYTAPGITSAASRAAQSGPLQVVTTDANGNLASDGGAIFSNINILNSQMARINQNLDQLNHDVKRLDGGVAMAMALGGVYLPEHQRFAIHTNVGFYNGAQALGVQGIARINRTFTANGGVAYDLTGNGGVGGRVGISAGW